HRLDAALPVSTGRVQQGVLADLRLPAAARAAGAAPAARVDHHVPDLAAVTAAPGHGASAHDDPRADPRVAVQVDEVVPAGRGPPGVLGPRGDGGDGADRERLIVAELGPQDAQRLFEQVAPPHRAVLVPGDEGDRYPAADAAGVRRRGLLHLRSEEHTSELQSREKLVRRLLLEKKNER